MWRGLATIDRWISWTRPAWRWLGQLALVALGLHLTADAVDDAAAAVFSRWSWPLPEGPRVVGTWVAVAAELLSVVWIGAMLAASAGAEPIDARGWWRQLSVRSALAPVAWLVWSAAGCWAVAMAVEDMVAAAQPAAARGLGAAAAVVVGARLAAPGWAALVRQPPGARRRRDGWVAALVVAPMCGFAIRHGLPLWG